MFVFIKNSFSGVVLNDIGFKRPPLQDKDEFAIKGITKEQIPNMDGDYLFYFTSDKDADKNNEGNTLAKNGQKIHSLSNCRLLKIIKYSK